MPTQKLIAYQIALSILFVLLLEVAARAAFTVYAGPITIEPRPYRYSQWLKFDGDLGWERRPNFRGHDSCGALREFDARGFMSIDSAQMKTKEAGMRTALFLGDSSTYGFCLDQSATFVEVAERLALNFKAINLGVSAYSSYQGYKALQKYGKLVNPDVLFISFNFNDRRYALVPDSGVAFEKLADLKMGPSAREYIYLVRAVRYIGVKLGLLDGNQPDAQIPIRLDTLRPRVDLENYRGNLIKMIHWARANSSIPVFIVLGDNPNLSSIIEDGVEYLLLRDYGSAIKYLTMAAERPYSHLTAIARIHLARAYRESGQTDMADRTLSMKLGLGAFGDGGLPIALDSDYNKIMRDVAKEYDVTVVDARSELNKRPRVFFDMVHFDGEGHQILGRLVADVLGKLDSLRRP